MKRPNLATQCLLGIALALSAIGCDTAAEPRETEQEAIQRVQAQIEAEHARNIREQQAKVERDLQIEGVSAQFGLKHGGTQHWIGGTITNVGTTTYQLVNVTFDLLDSNGVAIGSAFDVKDGVLRPGEAWRFKALNLEAIGAPGFRLSKLEAIKSQ